MRTAFMVTLVAAVLAVCCATWMVWDLLRTADPVHSEVRAAMVGVVR